MTRTSWTALLCGLACGHAQGQIDPNLGAASALLKDRAAGLRITRMAAGEAGQAHQVRQAVVASLVYDGTSSWGFRGQDYESVFDLYDVFVCEPFGLAQDAALTEFRSLGFGTSNPFGATDVIVEIYAQTDLDDLCDDIDLPTAIMRSIEGAGFMRREGQFFEGVTDFGGQCLGAGQYILRWGVEMNFTTFGSFNWFAQSGAHTDGLGEADDGFQSNPGGAFGLGECFATIDGGTGQRTGINFVLCGDADGCVACPDVRGCGDWDGDGDSDGADFFEYLAAFSAGDPCADLDANGFFDSLDFFAFLDRFLRAC